MNSGPLQGVRVTEFTSAWAGPYASCLLGFLGAEIIKVESLAKIDHSRFISFSTGKGFSGPDESSVFNSINLNKQSVSLNLTKPRAVAIAKELIKKSDVVMENMRPGAITRLGLDYEAARQVNPEVIYLSSSACGQSGPEREYIGYAPNFAAGAGLSYITGYEDWPPSGLLGAIDLRSANASAFAIMAALIYRQKTGEGQYIDLSSQESIAIMSGDLFMDYIMNKRVQGRRGNKDDKMAPHNCYRCQGNDEWLSIAVANDQEWQALGAVMGRPELTADERFARAEDRWKNQDQLDRIISAWTSDQDAYELMAKLQKAGVAAAPSMSSEMLFNDPHLQARGVFQQVEHPKIGKDWIVSPPWNLSETPASIRRQAPLLGEHNEEVFGGLLGMSEEEIRKLEEEQVIY